PIRDEGRADAGEDEHAQREPQGPDGVANLTRLRRDGRWATGERDGDAGDKNREQHHRAGDAQSLFVRGGGRVQAQGQRRDDQRGDRERDERRHHARLAAVEGLRSIAQSAEEEGESEYQEDVGQDRADERRLYDGDQARAQREDADEELGQIAD